VWTGSLMSLEPKPMFCNSSVTINSLGLNDPEELNTGDNLEPVDKGVQTGASSDTVHGASSDTVRGASSDTGAGDLANSGSSTFITSHTTVPSRAEQDGGL